MSLFSFRIPYNCLWTGLCSCEKVDEWDAGKLFLFIAHYSLGIVTFLSQLPAVCDRRLSEWLLKSIALFPAVFAGV